jgi:TPR repeat protein
LARDTELQTLRDTAKASQPAMNSLEQAARNGEVVGQFYFANLFDPEFKLSTIVQPDVVKAVEWYTKSANQGDEAAMSRLAFIFSDGRYTRVDYANACHFARKLGDKSIMSATSVKGDCYARGVGGTPVDMTQAARRVRETVVIIRFDLHGPLVVCEGIVEISGNS